MFRSSAGRAGTPRPRDGLLTPPSPSSNTNFTPEHEPDLNYAYLSHVLNYLSLVLFVRIVIINNINTFFRVLIFFLKVYGDGGENYLRDEREMLLNLARLRHELHPGGFR